MTTKPKARRQPKWLSHFGLSAPPFSKDLEDDQLWLPTSKLALVDELVEALDAREHVLLVGEPGVGKTCTLRALRRRLSETDFRLTYCRTPSGDRARAAPRGPGAGCRGPR